jgi:hypothetical protein
LNIELLIQKNKFKLAKIIISHKNPTTFKWEEILWALNPGFGRGCLLLKGWAGHSLNKKGGQCEWPSLYLKIVPAFLPDDHQFS